MKQLQLEMLSMQTPSYKYIILIILKQSKWIFHLISNNWSLFHQRTMLIGKAHKR